MNCDNYWQEKRITLKDLAEAWIPAVVICGFVLFIAVF